MSTIVEQLKAARSLKSEEDYDKFENALAEIDPTDLSLLPALYEVFDDGAEQLELMWQLLHLVCKFGNSMSGNFDN